MADKPYVPDPHVLRMSQNFVALMHVTGPYTDEQLALVLEKWFWERYNEQIAAALV